MVRKDARKPAGDGDRKEKVSSGETGVSGTSVGDAPARDAGH